MMSLSEIAVTYETNECPKKLLQYATEKRQEGMFNDVTIKVGNLVFPANRMILSCFSKFFERMFQTEMRERYEHAIEIKDFDGKAVKMLINFLYEGKINIEQENVMELLATSDFLQLEEVKVFCFDFLQNTMGVDNCIGVLAAYMLYKPQLSLDFVYRFIVQKLNQISQTDRFKSLAKNELISLLTNITKAEQSSIFRAIREWVKHDEGRRKESFSTLFQLIDLHQLTYEYLERVVITDQLVKENNDCLNAVVSQVFMKVKQINLNERESKILSLGGDNADGKKVIEVYNVSIHSNTVHPDLTLSLANHCVVNLSDVVYCIGGWNNDDMVETNKVYRLNLNEQTLQWEEVCSMNEERHYHGATNFKNSIVVCGGYYDRDSTELYELGLNKWKRLSSMKRGRSGHALVECNGCLYALGGDPLNKAPAVERLSKLNGEWEAAAPMQTVRSSVVAVNCGGCIYAIGGRDDKNQTLKVVEKFDPVENKWSYVSDMNNARCGHSACVLRGRIFVIGGRNDEGDVLHIESYDSMFDTWNIATADVAQAANDHALVAV